MVTQSQLNALNQQQQQFSSEQDDLMAFLSSPSNLASFETAGTQNTNISNSVDDVRTTRKERKAPSLKSVSSFKSRTSSTRDAGPLDDPDFAPPPLVHPTAQSKTFYELNAENEANYALLPKYEKIRHSGHIMTRFSTMSLVTRKWRQNFWILYGHVLYFFRSKEDFEEWLLNPYLSRESRASLVKRFLNFKDPESRNFIVGRASMKHYRNKGMMHHFKLDKQYIKGSDISLHLIAAFASINENDVNELQILLRQMLRGNKTSISNRNGPLSDTQSAYSSEFVFSEGRSSTKSASSYYHH